MTVVDAGLVWPLKRSFLAYVAGHAGGSTRISEGAGELGDGSFFFGFAARDGGRLSFSGRLACFAHGGLLDVDLADPLLDLDARTLSFRVRAASAHTALFDTGDAVAAADPGYTRVDALPVRLRAEAVSLFGDVYAAGTDFDPLTFRVPG